MALDNTQVIFKARPTGWVDDSHFEIRTVPAGEPADGEVLVKNLYMSVDPYMRGRMREGRSYVAGFELGKVLQAGVVGVVVKSRDKDTPEGTFVNGTFGWEQYSVVRARGLRKVDPDAAPLSYYLGVLGMPGMTAWVGLETIGKPQAGETVYVSAASGAVGQVVGQIAKLKGCRVTGSAGSDDKVAYIVDELGFDAGFNYHQAESLSKALRGVCPDGIDVYFENVGGRMLDAVLTQVNVRARIVACGMISQYNLQKPEGVHNLMTIVGNRVLMQGFIVSDHYDRLPEFEQQMAGWLREGKVKYHESVTEGIENAPRAFIGMLKGENFGKAVVHIADA
ncbi:MAG TPA: NADP-dependent oxidoreductase [Alphaproteobacteria bacterium]|nr:NADP-dependent oxidoreductase [Alphaproteobacteria bacterium]